MTSKVTQLRGMTVFGAGEGGGEKISDQIGLRISNSATILVISPPPPFLVKANSFYTVLLISGSDFTESVPCCWFICGLCCPSCGGISHVCSQKSWWKGT